jgi:Asp-tRNA(Asn)/Glu-tRNA(Gln) amidotransferase A subunit family amidase
VGLHARSIGARGTESNGGTTAARAARHNAALADPVRPRAAPTMTSPTPTPRPSRRAFLAAATAVPMLSPLPRLSPCGDDADDMAALGRLAGLEFTAEQRAQAKAQLQEQREQYAALRAQPIPFELPPCVTFDPLLPGAPRPAKGPGYAWQPQKDLAPPADDKALAFATVDELATWLRQGKVTSRKLTEQALARLQQHDAALHCVVTLLKDEALATADARDKELAAGKPRGPLHGIPYGAKDLFAWPGAPTTFGAAPYKDRVWDLRATVLDRLDAAGAVLVAKLSLGALAMNDVWFGGRTRNPWHPEEGSSGSSAGSASAVAAGLVPFALGTETLGSIVSPCQKCGVGGLRPTFGAISRHGAMPLSWTMDKIGPIARSAVDQALVFDAIRGADGKDPCARDAAFPFDPAAPLAGLRIGVLQFRNWPRRDEDQAFLAWIEKAAGKPVPVTLPDAPYGAMLLMLHAESAAAFDQLLRDGRLGELPAQGDHDWPNQFRSARCVPAVEYVQASRLRQQLLADAGKALAAVDVLVAPTHGGPTLMCTNLTGHPTCVLPVGTNEQEHGRPTVLALVGRLYGEALVLRVAAAWQTHTQWHRQRPPQFA